MQQNNFTNAILLQHNFINEDGISDILLNSTFVKDGKTVNQGDKRVCKIYQPPKQRELANYIHKFLVDLNDKHFKFKLKGIPSFDAPSRFEYLATEGGKFDEHIDIGPDELSTRKLSYSIQLSNSDEYEGGDLVFWPDDNNTTEMSKMMRQRGTIIVFPSYKVHAITPVTKGIRNCIVGWMHGDAFV